MDTQFITKELLGFYQKLHDSSASVIGPNNTKNYTVFFPQWGKQFPDTSHDGILFIGRATNGWKSSLADNLERAAADQFATCMLDNELKNWSVPSNSNYRLSRSAFWRVISRVTKAFYPNDWSEHIAWTNLYKVAPSIGYNPCACVRNAQLKDCDDILKKEIELLSPKYVIFLTGWCWFNDFQISKTMSGEVSSEPWGGRYVAKKWVVDNVTYILSEHPMVKPEQPHADALLKLMGK